VSDRADQTPSEFQDAAEEVGTAIRQQVEAVLAEAETRAAGLEEAARERVEQASRQASEEARTEADSIVRGARDEAEQIRQNAREEASRIQQQAVEQAANVAERARARLLKHVDATEQELNSLITGLRRDAESLGRD
jgi:vacuolar-type H+-ATPase subunit E/Vma4